MSRRSRIWRLVAVLFTVVNVGGAAYALMSGEPLHAAGHIALVVVTYAIWRLLPSGGPLDQPLALPAEERLDRLQQSLDAIAIEVERVGEAQRYATKILADRERRSPSEPS
jgi:hypothetical protein